MSDITQLQAEIEGIWKDDSSQDKKQAKKQDKKKVSKLIDEVLGLLDTGEVRVAEKVNGEVRVNEWLRQAILLKFRYSEMSTIDNPPFEYQDKLPLKKDYAKRGVRVVPGASARFGSYIAPGAILMPSYVNIGAYVGENTLVDTWATVGSCGQIGKNVHLSGGVGIGGVLEPPNAKPVWIGDECLIGSRCVVAEGAEVGDGSVLGAGCVLTGSIPVYGEADGETKELYRGYIPPWSVAISASRAFRETEMGQIYAPCIYIVKQLEEGVRHDKAMLNEVLRDHGTGI